MLRDVPRLVFSFFRVFLVLVREGVLEEVIPPDAPRFVRAIARGFDRLSKRAARPHMRETALADSFEKLGPSYVKLGQFLATRPDLVGFPRARALALLQDRMPFFPRSEAIALVESALGEPVDRIFSIFGEPVSAASIAQVHRACVLDREAGVREVAVKLLRPGIEARFRKNLNLFRAGARVADGLIPSARRLKLPKVVATLSRSVELEMDLRMEAAALSEMAANVAQDEGFRVPRVDWTRTGRRVLTMEWVEGIPLGERDRLIEAGHSPVKLARCLVQSFLRHAMRDGFFHADLHQGNLFVDEKGDLVAVDFGIMGRLGPKEQRFLAEILWGFIQRDYKRVAEVHFEAGYVPPLHGAGDFAQALRAIGEPLFGRDARDISMARLLTQLFEVTEQFNMETRPELLLLQKSMVVTEGVARTLDPDFNMWATAKPVAREWMETNLGAERTLRDFSGGISSLNRFIGQMPRLLDSFGTILQSEAELRRERDVSSPSAQGGRRVLQILLFFVCVSLSTFLVWVIFSG